MSICPEDIDMTKKYDIIWFAGCNMLSWVFGSDSSSIENKYLELEHFEKILTILKDDCMSSLSDLQPSTRGKIIFTEKGKNNQICRNIELEDNIPNLSVSIDYMYKRFEVIQDIHNVLIPDFMMRWNSLFKKIIIKDHIFYIKNELFALIKF